MNFDISRLQTEIGIVRLQGSIEPGKQQIHYRLAEFMSTDGWCEFDLSSPKANQLLDSIQDTVMIHLKQISNSN